MKKILTVFCFLLVSCSNVSSNVQAQFDKMYAVTSLNEMSSFSIEANDDTGTSLFFTDNKALITNEVIDVYYYENEGKVISNRINKKENVSTINILTLDALISIKLNVLKLIFSFKMPDLSTLEYTSMSQYETFFQDVLKGINYNKFKECGSAHSNHLLTIFEETLTNDNKTIISETSLDRKLEYIDYNNNIGKIIISNNIQNKTYINNDLVEIDFHLSNYTFINKCDRKISIPEDK